MRMAVAVGLVMLFDAVYLALMGVYIVRCFTIKRVAVRRDFLQALRDDAKSGDGFSRVLLVFQYGALLQAFLIMIFLVYSKVVTGR